jgi:hypothetical protein
VASSIRNLVALGGIWVAILSIPYFQREIGYLEIFVSFLLLFALYKRLLSLTGILQVNSWRLNLGLISLSGVFFFTSFTLLIFGVPAPYDFWSRLGAGSMEKDGKLFPFGDLAHLTSAASCQNGGVLAENSCDPWQREFNQNPDLPKILKLLNFSEANLLGLISSTVFLTLILWIVYRKKNDSLALSISVYSPVVILGIDRGNEVITLTCILIAVCLIESKGKIPGLVSVVALSFASFYKLWPSLLLFLVIFCCNGKIRLRALMAAIPSILYWGVNSQSIPPMLSSTQSGSPYGLSFGLKLFFSQRIQVEHALIFMSLGIVFFLFWWIKNGSELRASLVDLKNQNSFGLIVSVLLTYVGIWCISDSFIYRMMILIPALILLTEESYRQYSWQKSVVVLILVTLITGNLSITTAVSSSLALVALYISYVYVLVRIGLIGTSLPRKSQEGPYSRLVGFEHP